ncbi:adenylyl cyclase-associated protein 1-like [Erpetoichthys calabaricus]|uniref:CAP, adenylate cyclase-associated protein 1 (yeast) n=1 Tax=Erpetoichthys calabaricus TaxID=27687 RepID=A0A8C4SRI1_ERPCA|nr:adenylyl cyclase-associated protein 1-like [Erpetoichthys calabaricus]
MAELQGLIDRLERAVGVLENVVSKSGGTGCGDQGHSTAVAPFVEAFDAFLMGTVAPYYSQSQDIGGDVAKHAEMVKAAFNLQRQLLVVASQCQKPSDSELAVILQPMSGKIQEIQDFREKNRGSKQFNHLSGVSESVTALGWVTMSPKPGPFVKEMNDAAMFYTNRVLKDFKDTDKKQVEWVKTYLNIWSQLQAYIKEYHTTGLSWSKTGSKASPSCISSAGAPPKPGCGAPPPPPPPGPPPPPAPAGPPASSEEPVSRSALFAEINQGSNITKGLKHVSDDQKTHKNPALKTQSGPVRSGPKPFTAPKPGSGSSPAHHKVESTTKKPPVLELDGKKWKVENQENAQGLVINDTELKQVVYVYKCTNSTLHVKGKVNSITLDNCKKMGLVFDDVVGIVEVINCKDAKIQVMGKVPTVSINKTDGCHVYLSKNSLQCEIISAKSSEMNVLVPNNSGEFVELPVPEQFKTVWNGTKLVTTATEIAG